MLLLWVLPLLAQNPTITWGAPIQHNARNLDNLRIVATEQNGSFYTTYTERNQATLERYSADGQRQWSVAIAPRTFDDKPATYRGVALLNGKLHLISSSSDETTTSVFAQHISTSGNYSTDIVTLATTPGPAEVYFKAMNSWLLTILHTSPTSTIVTLLNAQLRPQWVETVPMQPSVHDIHITEKGTAHILTRQQVTGLPESAYMMHRFEGRNGKFTEHSIGHSKQRPLQAVMATLTNGDMVVAGYTTPAMYVVSQRPEPTGTFYYRFPKGYLNKPVANFSPIDSQFLTDYKRFKPDHDRIQRLRNLNKTQLEAMAESRVALIAEIYTVDNNLNRPIHHTDDILIMAFNPDGSLYYTTSANKHQSAPLNEVWFGSFFGTGIQDTLKLFYLDFKYNYNERDEMSIANRRTVQKTPVVASIYPDGTQKVKPIQSSQTGRNQNFYLIPATAYRVTDREFIVTGSGKGYYKFGRLKL
jgi:hypothetical protein